MKKFCRTLMILCLIANGNFLKKVQKKRRGTKINEYCFSPTCIHVSDAMLQAMDSSINPCDNFYKFTCGNFVKKAIVADYETLVSRRRTIRNTNAARFRRLLEEKVKPDDFKPFLLIKKLYNTCLNTTAENDFGLEYIKELIKGFGDWPVLIGNKWKGNKFDWKTTIYKIREAGINTNFFISLYISIDDRNSRKRRLKIDQPILKLGRQFLINGTANPAVQEYYNYMIEVAKYFGAMGKRMKNDLYDVIKFKIELAEILLTEEEQRDVENLYTLMTVEDLQKTYEGISWLAYINKLLAPYEKITKDEEILVFCRKYLNNLFPLLRKTPKRVLANFIIWKVILWALRYLSPDLTELYVKTLRKTDGITISSPPWKQCVDSCLYNLKIAASSLYVRHYFTGKTKESAEELVSNLRKQLEQLIGNNTWMDEQTKLHAIEKAKNIIAIVGYPNELLNNEILMKYYENLELNDGNYLQYAINISKFSYEKIVQTLREPMIRGDWLEHTGSYQVNAFQYNEENLIEFPAGNLQGIFFNNDFPKYINYGAAGRMIGHELTHGFDDIGRLYDKDGNLKDWWRDEVADAYKGKAEGVVKLYSKYKVPEIELNINGNLTQGENIADLGGIKIAYLAYDEWLRKHKRESLLPGLNFTERQMFWIATGNVWCNKYRPELYRRLVHGDDMHSPPEFRVIGMVSNTPQFARDFKCKRGSKMNPPKKYGVW